MNKNSEVEYRGKRSASFERAGMRVSLSGKRMKLQNTRNRAEQRELIKGYREWRDGADAEFRGDAQSILEQLQPYRAVAIIGYLLFCEGAANPETYKEWSHGGMSAKVEHIVLLLLSRDQDGFEDRLPFEVANSLKSYVDRLFARLMLYYGNEPQEEGADPRKPDPRIAVLGSELFVRMPTYLRQQKETLSELFSSVEQWMTAKLGFTALDVILIEKAFEDIDNAVLTEAARSIGSGIIGDLRRISKFEDGQLVAQPGHEDEAQLLNAKFQVEWSKNLAEVGVGVSHGADEVARHAGISEQAARAALEFFTIDREESRDYFMPIPDSPLKKRPFVEINGRWLLPSPTLLLPAVQMAIESALNPAFSRPCAVPEVWESYVKHRAELLEARSCRALSTLLGGVDVQRNLKYKSVAGQKSDDELDGLAQVDGKLFLFEGKAGGFGWTSRRGDIDAIEGRIEQLITDAHKQALRALAFVRNRSLPQFRVGKDTLVVDMSRVTEVFIITTTFEQLGYLTSSFTEVDRVRQSVTEATPWVVSLHDIELVAKYVPNIPTFVHYLRRRVEQNVTKAMRGIFDELDWFGRYFYDALTFVEIKDIIASGDGEIATLGLASHTAQFDDFELFEEGLRTTPASRPEPQVHREIKRLVESLNDWRGSSFIDIALCILDLAPKQQRAFGKRLGRAYISAKRLRVVTERALSANGDLGVACTVMDSEAPEGTIVEPPKNVHRGAHIVVSLSGEVIGATFRSDARVSVSNATLVGP